MNTMPDYPAIARLLTPLSDPVRAPRKCRRT